MQDDVKRLKQLLREGKCCAAALVEMGLASRGESNPLLLQAVSGLCGGVQGGLLCGALTGAACMLNVVAPDQANALLVPELTEWFTAAMGEQYGGSACADILAGDPHSKSVRCPAVVEATYLQVKEILRNAGYEFN